ncbi:MAG: hypothetical protein AAB833_02245 [Patescibacteria group bacterium]
MITFWKKSLFISLSLTAILLEMPGNVLFAANIAPSVVDVYVNPGQVIEVALKLENPTSETVNTLWSVQTVTFSSTGEVQFSPASDLINSLLALPSDQVILPPESNQEVVIKIIAPAEALVEEVDFALINQTLNPPFVGVLPTTATATLFFVHFGQPQTSKLLLTNFTANIIRSATNSFGQPKLSLGNASWSITSTVVNQGSQTVIPILGLEARYLGMVRNFDLNPENNRLPTGSGRELNESIELPWWWIGPINLIPVVNEEFIISQSLPVLQFGGAIILIGALLVTCFGIICVLLLFRQYRNKKKLYSTKLFR